MVAAVLLEQQVDQLSAAKPFLFIERVSDGCEIDTGP
jgi:hypothetical protein